MPHSRNILIVGGLSGIGRAIAEAFAASGDQVLGTARTPAEIDSSPPLPANITPHVLDVTDEPAMAAFVDQQMPDHLDVLVNCAGMILRGGHEFDAANFARVLDVNLTGTMRMCLAAKDRLMTARGCIINIASMLSFFGSGVAPAYASSKGGVAQLTKSLAIAWAADGIRVNAIAPGWIKTALTEPLVSEAAKSAAILARTPMARWGEPADIAGTALFLASPAASFITGAIIPVDGGYSIA